MDTEFIKRQLADRVQAYMNSVVHERGYDNLTTACTYIDTGHPQFDSEGRAARLWRSAVWKKCYEVLDEVNAGLRPIPTAEELIAELPEIEWGDGA